MAARSTLGLTQPAIKVKLASSYESTALLQLEGMRGGDVLTVRFDSITAWVDASQQVRGSDEMQGLKVHLANGDRVALLLVSFDYLTEVMQEHYGEQFDKLFATEAQYETRCFVRTEHILGWTKGAGTHKLQVLGQHDLPRVRLSAQDTFGPATVIVRQQPEAFTAPSTAVAPLPRFPVYAKERTYHVGELVLHGGSLYRRATRSGNDGDPLQCVSDWDFIRTLEGPEPIRDQAAKVTTPRKPGISDYSEHASYGFGDLVNFKGSTYRKLTRSTRNGSPSTSPEDWDRLPAAKDSLLSYQD